MSRSTWLTTNLNPKGENILTADELKLASLFNYLLVPFYTVTQQCSSKNNALLSSVIPHAAVLKKFFNHKASFPPGQSSSTT